MENTTNRNDVINFFKDMPQQMQIETINKMQRQIKKPPDTLLNAKPRQSASESEGGPVISELSVK
mgnify:FL=1